jgi:hypothetical protein
VARLEQTISLPEYAWKIKKFARGFSLMWTLDRQALPEASSQANVTQACSLVFFIATHADSGWLRYAYPCPLHTLDGCLNTQALRYPDPVVKIMKMLTKQPAVVTFNPPQNITAGTINVVDCNGSWLDLLVKAGGPLFAHTWAVDGSLHHPCNVCASSPANSFSRAKCTVITVLETRVNHSPLSIV